MALVLFPFVGTRDSLAQTLAGARANQNAIDDLQTSIAKFLVPTKPVSWSVLRKLAESRAATWTNPALVRNGSELTNLSNRSAWYEETQRKLENARMAIR